MQEKQPWIVAKNWQKTLMTKNKLTTASISVYN